MTIYQQLLWNAEARAKGQDYSDTVILTNDEALEVLAALGTMDLLAQVLVDTRVAVDVKHSLCMGGSGERYPTTAEEVREKIKSKAMENVLAEQKCAGAGPEKGSPPVSGDPVTQEDTPTSCIGPVPAHEEETT
jgi:hypothetical protein